MPEAVKQSGADLLASDLVDGRVAPDRENVLPVQFVLQYRRRLRYREAFLRRCSHRLAQADALADLPANSVHHHVLVLVDGPVVKIIKNN